MDHHPKSRGRWLVLLSLLLGGIAATPAAAQPSRGVMRLSIDTDVLSMASVEREDAQGQTSQTTVYGIGPNQLGGSAASPEVLLGPTPLGLGLAFGVSGKLLLGIRLGLGVDIVSPDGDSSNVRVLKLGMMPGLTWVPLGGRTKMFLSASPIFQFDRLRVEEDKARTLLGGFGLGVGALIFVARAVSVDLGFHFEGRFGNYENVRDEETELRDLRGLVRLGLSVWK